MNSQPTTTTQPRSRWRKVATVAAYVAGAYFVLRAIAEPFLIDLGDPSTYRHDWGGPHLAGVLAVHMGLGAVALAAMVLHRRR
jgi:hypothetical protein